MRLSTIHLALLAATTLIACNDASIPHGASPADSAARAFLHVLQSRDTTAIRTPLNERGRNAVTAESLGSIFRCFDSGPPLSATLISSEVATSDTPTPAERHRLIYRLEFPDERKYYYHFEMTIRPDDTSITGFQMEPAE